MSARRRKNPAGLLIGAGVVTLLAAGGAWWYFSTQTSEGQNGRAALKERVAARGGKRVGGVSLSLSSDTFRPSLRQSSGLNISPRQLSTSSPGETASPDPADLTQPFTADGAPV